MKLDTVLGSICTSQRILTLADLYLTNSQCTLYKRLSDFESSLQEILKDDCITITEIGETYKLLGLINQIQLLIVEEKAHLDLNKDGVIGLTCRQKQILIDTKLI